MFKVSPNFQQPQNQIVPHSNSKKLITEATGHPLLHSICNRIKYIFALFLTIATFGIAYYLSSTIQNILCSKKIEISAPQPIDHAKILEITPKFQKYGFRVNPNVHLTDLDVRPNNLFYSALFGNQFTTKHHWETYFLEFNEPLNEIKSYIFSLPDTQVISVSAKGCRANLYNKNSGGNAVKEVDLSTYLGTKTCEISVKEIKEMLNSQRIFVSKLIPKKFYLGLKEVIDQQKWSGIGGRDNNPRIVSDLAKRPAFKKFFENVKSDPSKYGFVNDGVMLPFSQVLHLSVFQIGAMVVKSDDYHCLIGEGFEIRDRKVGQKDALMQISASGIRGFFNSLQTPENANHQLDYKIMMHTFQTMIKAAGKNAHLIMPALGMGVWRGLPEIYWNSFLDAVAKSGSDLETIFVNPRHQTTTQGLYQGSAGEEFAKILEEYKKRYPQNANLNKIVNLYNEESDLLLLAQNLKAAHPQHTVALVNASDPEVTLGVVGPGEYANDLCHAQTTEENFAVAAATLGFEELTGVLKDPKRVLVGG